MGINIKTGRANIVTAKVSATFAEMGLNNDNINVIFQVEDFFLSWQPNRPFNSLSSGVTASLSYYIISKVDLDLTAYFFPPFDIPSIFPVAAFPTYNAMVAANLPVRSFTMVTSDADATKNGTYTRDYVGWYKSDVVKQTVRTLEGNIFEAANMGTVPIADGNHIYFASQPGNYPGFLVAAATPANVGANDTIVLFVFNTTTLYWNKIASLADFATYASKNYVDDVKLLADANKASLNSKFQDTPDGNLYFTDGGGNVIAQIKNNIFETIGSKPLTLYLGNDTKIVRGAGTNNFELFVDNISKFKINSNGDILFNKLLGSTIREDDDYILCATDTAGNIIFSIDKNGKVQSLTPVTDNSGLQGKKLAVLGDSMSTLDYGNLIEGQQWWRRLDQWNGFSNIYYDAISGSAVVDSPLDTQLDLNNDARLLAVPADRDIITIWMGSNDFGKNRPLGTNADAMAPNTTFYAGLKYLYYTLHQNCRKAKIFHLTPAHRSDKAFPERSTTNYVSSGNTHVATNAYLADYVRAIKEVAFDYTVSVIDVFNESGLNYWLFNSAYFSLDGLHLINEGQLYVAKYINSQLKSKL